jgi:uncharacterized protein YjiS (DUF1127 family)
MHAASLLASRSKPPVERAGPPLGSKAPASPDGLIATWRWRMRYRRELEEKSKAAPHLLDDIGLSRWDSEAEVAKPFWQR